MNKSLLGVLMLALTSVVYAQENDSRKFRVGLGVGIAKAGGKDSGAGGLFVAEPGWRVNHNLVVNLRLESAFLIRELELNPHGIFSCTGGGIYYLSNKNLKPYIGAGLGFYGLTSVTTSGLGIVGAEIRPGLYPRIGVDWRRFNVNIDYNFIVNTEILNENRYLGLRVGGYLFRRKK